MTIRFRTRYRGIGIKLRTGMGALLAIAAWVISTPSPATAAWSPVPNYRAAVPVLCYHGIADVTGSTPAPYTLSRAEFARHIAMLADSGFHTISIAEYARFAAGDATALPDRPILITFDDGRLDSYQGADQVLASYGMRATMFVITANAAGPKPGYLSWAQLSTMAASGRWDLQEHADAGHVLIPTAAGKTGPYYANLLYRNGARETFTTFKRRVTGDILEGRRLMAAHFPGFEPLAFAPPYDNYGQIKSNYAPIAAWESAWLLETFKVFFLQDRRVFNLPGNPIGQRYGIRAGMTAESLNRWLAQSVPPSAVIPEPAEPTPQARPRPQRPKARLVRAARHQVVIVFRRIGKVRFIAARRRVGHRRKVAVRVRGRRLRDRRLRAGTAYVYRVIAVDGAGTRSTPLQLRVRTRR